MIVESLEHDMQNSLLEETLEECVNEFTPMLGVALVAL